MEGLTTKLCVVPTTLVPLLQEYVKPVPAFAVNVVDVPAQIVAALAMIVADGAFTTFTVTVSVSTQLFASVPVTVYVVVAVGDATTDEPTPALKLADGLHT